MSHAAAALSPHDASMTSLAWGQGSSLSAMQSGAAPGWSSGLVKGCLHGSYATLSLLGISLGSLHLPSSQLGSPPLQVQHPPGPRPDPVTGVLPP